MNRRRDENADSRANSISLVFPLCLLIVSAGSCSVDATLSPGHTETVMSEGMQIVASTKSGTIRIGADRGYRRTYRWGSCSKAVTLTPRPERWHGSLGIYSPGAGPTWWIPCGGVWRAVVEEGQQHFDSYESATEWIGKRRGLEFVYRNDGLVVGWLLSSGRDQINVEVWQILISGRKPDHLDGADDTNLTITTVLS